MKIGDLVFNLSMNCKYCGHNFYKVKYVKPHIGLYCDSCGKWHKWLSKEEKSKYGLIAVDDVDELEKADKIINNILNSVDEVPWF